MIRNKNKGFTLVELLAVIAILAVILVITILAVTPRLNRTKKNVFMDEALAYLKAGKIAYVSDSSIECYNISDLKQYVKQPKEGYSGALYVNESGKYTLYLTNGKYYMISDNSPINEDITETEPDKFVSSCSDFSDSFTISYDLNGGTLSIDNPTTYNANTPTFTLNNPTRSGYRFVGWSTKNLASNNPDDYTNGVYSNFPIDLTSGNKYVFSAYLKGQIVESNYYNYCVVKSGDVYREFQGLNCIINVYNLVPGSPYKFTVDSSWTSPKLVSFNNNNKSRMTELFNNYNIQFEEGTTATDYQEYMAPTIDAKVYRGSTGNKKYIANWEAL